MRRSDALFVGCLAAALAATGCSSSSSTTPAGDGGGARVTGTAAAGAPIAGATVTLVSSTGIVRTGTTGAGGTFSIDAAGLTPPFLVAVAQGGRTLYSVSADAAAATTINVTPLTDLIIRSWYEVQGLSMAAAFAAPAANPPPSPPAVAVIAGVVTRIVQARLQDAGVDLSAFNPISTPFAANGAGIDGVLDWVEVDTTNGVVTVTDPSHATTQVSEVTYGIDGSMAVSTTTAGAGGTTTSTDGTVVPVAVAQQAALVAISTACDQFAAAVNANSVTLAAGVLTPFMDPAAMWGGMSREEWAAMLAWFLRGKIIGFSQLSIRSLDTVSNVADVVLRMSMTQGGQTAVQVQEFQFTKVGSAWLLHGDQRIANVEVRANMVTNQGAMANPAPSLVIEVHADAPEYAVSSVTVQGGPWAGATPAPFQSKDLPPWDATGVGTRDAFETYDVGGANASAGAPFVVVVTPTAGAPASYTLPLNAITTEAIRFTNVVGSTLADAQLGAARTVRWTLPTTYAISEVRVGTVAQHNELKCEDMASTVLNTSATSATVTIAATCGGLATLWAEIYVQAFGVNGELATAYYQYQ